MFIGHPGLKGGAGDEKRDTGTYAQKKRDQHASAENNPEDRVPRGGA